jgi:uncharacterized membrane protein (UPF0127 family)
MPEDDPDTPAPRALLEAAPDHVGDRDPAALQLRLRGELVTSSLVRADTMWSRMRGLLGRRELPADEGLWITPCPSIHMWFMRFAIDAVFLDDQHQVVRVCADLRPWRIARGGKFARSVLELPQGKAAFFNLRVGDRLELASAQSARNADAFVTKP